MRITATALMIAGLLAGCAAPVVPPVPGEAVVSEAPGAACDRLAGAPDDKAKVGPGVPFDDIDRPAATAACRAAVAQQPDNARLHFQLGRALNTQDDVGARREYAAAVDRHYVYAYANLGYLMLRGVGGPRDIPSARAVLQQGVDAGDLESMYALGDSLATGRGGSRDVAAGMRLMQHAADAGLPSALDGLAWYIVRHNGRLSDARRYAEAAVASDPNSSNSLDTLAYVLLRMGDPAGALVLETRATGLDPKDVGIHDRRGDMLAALGRKPEAIAEWEQALALPTPNSYDEDLFTAAQTGRKISHAMR
jgi:TPR repeat protein